MIPSGAVTNHDRLPSDVFDAAMMAAFPGLPQCMTLDEAGRLVAAALNAAWPLIEHRIRGQVADELDESAGAYDPAIWRPDSPHPDAIAARAMRHAYTTAARLTRRGTTDDEDTGCETDNDEGPEPADGDHGTCATCGKLIEFIDPRDGMPGVWRHVQMPADHYAQLGGPA